MNRRNPVAINIQPLAGQRLPDGWRKQTADVGGTYDRRNWGEVFNQPQWRGQSSVAATDNITQNSRLSK
jgi:hypothetical protein